MAAIEDGLYQPAMKACMAELERERAEITARLTATLRDPETRLESSSDIRSLVAKIVLHPGEKRGEVHAILHGSLIGILDFANDNPRPDATRVITSVSLGSSG